MEQKVVPEADVAVTKRSGTLVVRFCLALVVTSTLLLSVKSLSAVLPEERADLLYHSYEGGGMTIDGPSVLVRKNLGNVSLWGNYYEDYVSSASVDVLTQATIPLGDSGPVYDEERIQTSVGANYLYNKTLFSLSFTNSDENDYEANTVAFGISQDFFGDLSTISLNYSRGDDTIYKNIRDNETIEITGREFMGEATHQRFALSLTQILTKNLIMSFTAETVVDEGFLNNPYRNVRFFPSDNPANGQIFVPEIYPTTRNSDAGAIRAMYYLPYRASLRLEYRLFNDSWGMKASNYELRYLHPLKNRWTFEGKYRVYEQTEADFFQDVFSEIQIIDENQNFRASDKELDALNSTTIGFGVSYELKPSSLPIFERASVNLFWDIIAFEYENYRDRTQSVQIRGEPATAVLGAEPLYSLDANVIRLFLSVWY